MVRERLAWACALVFLVVAGMALAFQRPLSVPLNIGYDEARDNDQPFVVGFHEPELRDDTGGQYRWTMPDAALVYPPLPARAALLRFHQINGSPLTLQVAGHRLEALTPGRTAHIYLPPQAAYHIGLVAPEFPAAGGDPRSLGAALEQGALRSLGGWALPPLLPLVAWGCAVAALLATIWLLGGGLHEGLLPGLLLASAGIIGTWLAPLRISYGAWPLLQTIGYAAVWATALAALARRIWRDEPIPPQYLRWMIVASTAVWALKVGGRLLPASMPGDIGYHRNRVLSVMIGDIFRPSQHRGVATPYPTALYVLVQPLTVLGISIEWLLQLIAAACETLGITLIFGLVWRLTKRPRAALAAGALYGMFPASFMIIAWSFDSHMFAQLAALAWSSALILTWGRWHRPAIAALLAGGLALVMLSHYSFYINISAVPLLLAGLIWLFRREQRRQAWWLLLIFAAAQALAWGLYYGVFLSMFWSQIQEFTSGGMTAVNDRPPLPRSTLLWDTITSGFWRHFALVPLLLAPFGWRRLWAEEGTKPAALVIAATVGVSLALGMLPIITAAPITTRWLMFSAWALAVCAGIGADRLWEHSQAGRGAVVGGGLLVAGLALWVWVEAFIYRIRPPEPF